MPARILLAAIIAVAAVIHLMSVASAHDAVTGWHYPARCCGEGDCADAIAAIRNPDGSLTVTTKHGTATFPASFQYEQSPDHLIHACFTPAKLYCLFLSTGG